MCTPLPGRQSAASGRPPPCAAFTLIELLVVIVIIAILAGLLLPVFGSAKRKGYQTASISNLRQWGTALAASLVDHNNTFPHDGQGSGQILADHDDAWFNRLPPYISEKRIKDRQDVMPPKVGEKSLWINPGAPTTNNAKVKVGGPYLFCYAMNYWLYSKPADGKPSGFVSMPSVEYPSGTVFMGENFELNYSVCNPKDIRACYGIPEKEDSSGNVIKNPESVANFLFCDGHVRSLTRKEFEAKEATDDTAKTLNSAYTYIPYVGAPH